MGFFSRRSFRKKKNKKNSKQNTKPKPDSVRRKPAPRTNVPSVISTVSKSSRNTPPTKDRMESTDDEKQKALKKKKKESKSDDFRDSREKEVEEKKSSDEKEDVSNTKSNAFPTITIEPSKTQEPKGRNSEEEKVKLLLTKYKKEKDGPKSRQMPLDNKSKLLMDRVVKKPYPLKYTKRSKEALLNDEKSSFFKLSSKSRSNPKTVSTEENGYTDLPKLADVLKMPEESVFIAPGVPFWAEYTDPKEDDMIDVEPVVTVGSDTLELFHDRQLTLISGKSIRMGLDVFNPLTKMMSRDESHFNHHSVFSNTVRSLINIQQQSEPNSANKKTKQKTSTSSSENIRKIRVENSGTEAFFYSRHKPIESVRAKLQEADEKRTVDRTTKTCEVTD